MNLLPLHEFLPKTSFFVCAVLLLSANFGRALTAPEALSLTPHWGPEQGNLFTHTGIGAGDADISRKQQGSTVFGYETSATGLHGAFRLADDFSVPAGGWTVAGIFLFAYQENVTNPSFSGDINIWDREPGTLGATVVSSVTFNNAWNQFSGVYRTPFASDDNTDRPIQRIFVPLNEHLPLSEGTYWLDWQLTGALDTKVFTPPTSIADRVVGDPPIQFRGDPRDSLNVDDFQWYPISVGGCCDDPFVNLPFEIVPVPEPKTYALAGIGFLALIIVGRRFRALRAKR